jgi:hypothetical protein
MNETLQFIKDYPGIATVIGGAVMALILSYFIKGLGAIRKKIVSSIVLWWGARSYNWFFTSEVKKAKGSKIEFRGPEKVYLSIPREIGFKVTCKVKLLNRTVPSGGPFPDFRIYMQPEITKFPYCFIIFPWENIELNSDHFECHMNWSPGPQEGNGDRLRQVPVCSVKNLPFKFKMILQFTNDAITFRTSIWPSNIEFTVPISDLKQRSYPLNKPQYISFASPNSSLRISRIRVQKV